MHENIYLDLLLVSIGKVMMIYRGWRPFWTPSWILEGFVGDFGNLCTIIYSNNLSNAFLMPDNIYLDLLLMFIA